MTSLEKRAWLTLWSMCPAYIAYFAILAAFPTALHSLLERLGLLAVVAIFHAVTYVTGLLLIKRREAGDDLLLDERDRIIDARTLRIGYFILLTGMIVVGVVMPFNKSGWQIVNAALFVIVLTEAIRCVLVLVAYRRPRLSTEALANDVRLLRFLAQDMTQAELGKRVGLTRQTIAAIEQGRYAPSLDAAFRIAHVFGKRIDEVFHWQAEGDLSLNAQ